MMERGLLLSGILLLGVFVASYLHREIMVRAEMERFKEAQLQESRRPADPKTIVTKSAVDSAARNARQSALLEMDPALRPAGRVRGAESRLGGNAVTPMAVLRIPKLNLEVPVLNGTDRFTLNRGVGRIPGTAFPGETGNIGIAGHRDGFFRGLKDIHMGDKIELLTAKGTDIYTVDRILITDPSDVSVLDSGTKPALTLVTCYPFHYIGPAPRRFIVEASLQQ
jgi:sortase A